MTQELQALLAYINALDATLKPPALAETPAPPTPEIAPEPIQTSAAPVAAVPTPELPAAPRRTRTAARCGA